MIELIFLMTLAAASGASLTFLFYRHHLLHSLRRNPVKTIRRLCRQAYPPDDLLD